MLPITCSGISHIRSTSDIVPVAVAKVQMCQGSILGDWKEENGNHSAIQTFPLGRPGTVRFLCQQNVTMTTSGSLIVRAERSSLRRCRVCRPAWLLTWTETVPQMRTGTTTSPSGAWTTTTVLALLPGDDRGIGAARSIGACAKGRARSAGRACHSLWIKKAWFTRLFCLWLFLC